MSFYDDPDPSPLARYGASAAALGPRAPWKEQLNAAANRAALIDSSMARARLEELAYDGAILKLKQAGKTGFVNPYNASGRVVGGGPIAFENARKKIADAFAALPEEARENAQGQAEVWKPNLDEFVRENMAFQRRQAAETAEAARPGVGPSLIGGLVAPAGDPENIIGLFVPEIRALRIGGEARPILNGVIQGAVANALIEAGVQPVIKDNYAISDMPYSLQDAANNVASAALFGGALTGLSHAAPKAYDLLRRRFGRDAAAVPPAQAPPSASAEPPPSPPAGPGAPMDIRPPPVEPPETIARGIDASGLPEDAAGLDRILGALRRAGADDLTPLVESVATDEAFQRHRPADVQPEEHQRALASEGPADAASLPETPARADLRQALDAIETPTEAQHERAARQAEWDNLFDYETRRRPRERPAPAEAPAPHEGVAEIEYKGRKAKLERLDPRTLQTDAETFQYRRGGDQSGVTARLQNVSEWDPVSSGKTLVWERKDGTRFIADGHQRLGLALRILESGGDPAKVKLDGYVFKEADGWEPKELRVLAAAKNIREGNSDPLDTASILREAPDVLDGSIPVSAENMRQARGLAQLSDEAWGAANNEVISTNYAAQIGALYGRFPETHMGLIEAVRQAEPANISQANFVIRDAFESGFVAALDGKQTSIFDSLGDDFAALSATAEKMQVLDHAFKVVREDRRLYKLLEAHREELEQAGNQLNVDANRRARVQSDISVAMLQLATRKGPVADALKKAAYSAIEGKAIKEASDGFLADLRALIDKHGIKALVEDGESLRDPAAAAQDYQSGDLLDSPPPGTEDLTAPARASFDPVRVFAEGGAEALTERLNAREGRAPAYNVAALRQIASRFPGLKNGARRAEAIDHIVRHAELEAERLGAKPSAAKAPVQPEAATRPLKTAEELPEEEPKPPTPSDIRKEVAKARPTFEHVKDDLGDYWEINIEAPTRRGTANGLLQGGVVERGGKPAFWTVKSASVDPSLMHQGAGMKMYLEAVKRAFKEGVPLASDARVSDAAAAVYDRLERNGYRVLRNPDVDHAFRQRVAGNEEPVYFVMPPKDVRTLDEVRADWRTAKGLSSENNRLAELEALANQDAMLPVLNRRGFTQAFERYRETAGALVYLDLNNLKPINDSLGHLAGDAALARLAGVLKEHASASDHVARLGGDEFAVLVTGENSADRAAKIADAARTISFTHDGNSVELSAAVGIHHLNSGESFDAALSAADAAMYENKRATKGIRRAVRPAASSINDLNEQIERLDARLEAATDDATVQSLMAQIAELEDERAQIGAQDEIFPDPPAKPEAPPRERKPSADIDPPAYGETDRQIGKDPLEAQSGRTPKRDDDLAERFKGCPDE